VCSICRCLIFAVVLAPMSVAQPVTRLQGLERLYFEHVGGNDEHSEVPSFLAKFLPPEIRASKFSPRKAVREVMDGELGLHVETRDFNLPQQRTSSDLWLRQIILDTGAARITWLWWALYDHGRRTDVWYFSADPDSWYGEVGRKNRIDSSKVLSNYEIEAVSATTDGVELQVYGSMFRPGGAWWITGKTFTFSMQNETLQLTRVLNTFGFFQGYDVGDTRDLVDVTTEQEVGGRFQIQNYDKIQESILRACGFGDHLRMKIGSSIGGDWRERLIASRRESRGEYPTAISISLPSSNAEENDGFQV
jgi:hypothetical protein